MLFDKKKSFYFIGIGGVGMFPLATLLVKNGFTVSGSDQKKNRNVERLEALGVKVFPAHKADNIHSFETIIYSSAISMDNVELKEAYTQKKELLHRSDLLKAFVNSLPSVTVVGTHGKTTTTALVEDALNSNPKETSSIGLIGGINLSSKNHRDLENFRYVIAEADESDGSFLKYKPDITLLTNIEKDHLDYFKDFSSIVRHFEKHTQSLKGQKILIYNFDDPHCRQLAERFSGKKISYGFSPKADLYASNISHQKQVTHFTLQTPSAKASLEIPLLGKHNVMNALGALSVAYAIGDDLTHVYTTFRSLLGVRRRLELIHHEKNYFFYDDYAHNPGKIAACLEALRQHFPSHKIIALFEPHRFSRVRFLFEEFIQAFQQADFTFVFPYFCAGESPSKGDFTTEQLARGVEKHCYKPAKAVYNDEEGYKKIIKEMTEEVVLVALGAGDISKTAHQIREQIKCESSLLKKDLYPNKE